jgi:type I restriction enzyme S subunit
MMAAWKQDKIFRLCDKVGSGGTPDSSNPDYYDGAIQWVQTGDLNYGLLSQTEKTITEQGLESSSAKIYPAGTLLVAMYGATIGKIGIIESPAATNQACCAMNFRSIVETKYMFYKFLDIRELFIAQGYGGGQKNISQEIVKQTYVSYPQKDEQRRIVAYLDKTCAVIDAVIEKKQKQLETLDALRKSIIHKAVTRGLRDSVELRDSGVEWIGKIPASWKVTRLKNVARLRYGLGQPPQEKEEGVPMIRATNIDAGNIIENELLRVDPDALPLDREPYLKEDDIIVVRSGAYTGDSAIIPRKYSGAVAGYDMVVTVKSANPKFVSYALLSTYVLDGQLLLMTLRAAQPHLNAEELGSILIVLPKTIKEQQEIALHIENKLRQIDEVQNNLLAQIATLEQYRKSLIHGCVTGKRRITEEDIQQY